MDGVNGVKFLSWLGRFLALLLLTAALMYLLLRLFPGISRFSDGLALIGLLEVIVAGGSLWGASSETSGSLWMRYMIGVPASENRNERLASFWADFFAKQTFAGQALLCGLVTVLAALVVSLLGG